MNWLCQNQRGVVARISAAGSAAPGSRKRTAQRRKVARKATAASTEGRRRAQAATPWVKPSPPVSVSNSIDVAFSTQ